MVKRMYGDSAGEENDEKPSKTLVLDSTAESCNSDTKIKCSVRSFYGNRPSRWTAAVTYKPKQSTEEKCSLVADSTSNDEKSKELSEDSRNGSKEKNSKNICKDSETSISTNSHDFMSSTGNNVKFNGNSPKKDESTNRESPFNSPCKDPPVRRYYKRDMFWTSNIYGKKRKNESPSKSLSSPTKTCSSPTKTRLSPTKARSSPRKTWSSPRNLKSKTNDNFKTIETQTYFSPSLDTDSANTTPRMSARSSPFVDPSQVADLVNESTEMKDEDPINHHHRQPVTPSTVNVLSTEKSLKKNSIEKTQVSKTSSSVTHIVSGGVKSPQTHDSCEVILTPDSKDKDMEKGEDPISDNGANGGEEEPYQMFSLDTSSQMDTSCLSESSSGHSPSKKTPKKHREKTLLNYFSKVERTNDPGKQNSTKKTPKRDNSADEKKTNKRQMQFSKTGLSPQIQNDDENNLLFDLPTSVRKTPQNRKKPMKKKVTPAKEQMYIDVGQKDFGHVKCESCGMVYTKSQEEDEEQHAKYHQKIVQKLRFNGWKAERILEEFPDGRIISIKDSDNFMHLKKLNEIREVVDGELGFASSQEKRSLGQYEQAFLFIHSKKVVGCVIAVPITKGCTCI
ncbi:N-acetyltransferase ESCO1-like isoform X2 [Clytia hemisphaerica]|uniref:N-acetyltransferase ESCO1-like isoform X2 n=1 Tax=Clytia hemisphaerica TaxID=252671 RepID=UPI0034D73CCD